MDIFARVSSQWDAAVSDLLSLEHEVGYEWSASITDSEMVLSVSGIDWHQKHLQIPHSSINKLSSVSIRISITITNLHEPSHILARGEANLHIIRQAEPYGGTCTFVNATKASLPLKAMKTTLSIQCKEWFSTSLTSPLWYSVLLNGEDVKAASPAAPMSKGHERVISALGPSPTISIQVPVGIWRCTILIRSAEGLESRVTLPERLVALVSATSTTSSALYYAEILPANPVKADVALTANVVLE